MRPRYLEVEGLQSFKELQRVDFDKLSETGLFGIFGPTGSGKSTILDAITLALYGNVNRAVKGTQGIINTDMGGIKVAFTFDLAKEGMRKTYRVERQYKRKKDSDSSAEAKLVRLLEVRDEQEYILADKHGDVNAFIVQLLGLKFEDFTRSVVLPQNKFQEFLLSPRGEKTKMLERIFYLEEYGRRLADKFNREMSVVKNKLSNIDGALSTLGNSSPEALIESEKKMTEANKHRNSCNHKLKITEESYGKGMELYKLSGEYIDLQKRLAEFNARSLEMQSLQALLRRSEAANKIKSIILAFKEASSGYSENKASLEGLQERLRLIEMEKTAAQQSYDMALKLKDERLPEIIKYKTMLQECQVMQQEMAGLTKQLDVARKEYEEIRIHMEAAKKAAAEKTQQKDILSREVQDLEQKAEMQRVGNEERKQISLGLDLEKELQALETGLKKQEDKCLELQNNLSEYQSRYTGAMEDLNKGIEASSALNKEKAHYETSRPINREEIAEKQGKVILIEGLLQNILAASDALEGLGQRLKDYKQQAAALEAEQAKVEQSLQHAISENDKKHKLLNEIMEHQKQHTAALLASALIAGEQCPVCGALEHPNPAIDTAAQDNKAVEQKQNELQAVIEAGQKHIRELEHQLIKLKQQQTSLLHIIEQTDLEQKSRQLDYQKHRNALPEEIKTLEQHELQGYIAKEKKSMTEAAQVYTLWEQKLELLVEGIRQHEHILSETKINESKLAVLFESTNTALQQEQLQLAEQKKHYAVVAEKHKEMKAKYHVSSFIQEAEKAALKDEQGQQLSTSIKQQRGLLDTLVSELQTVLEEINEISNTLSMRKSEGLKLKEQKEEKEKKIISIIGNKNLELELKQAVEEIEQLEASYKNSLEVLNNASKPLEEVQRNRAGLLSSFEYFKEKQDIEGKRLEEALAKNSFSSQEEAEACMLTEEKIALHQEEAAKFQREKGSLEDRLQSVAKQLGGKLMDEEQWQQLRNEYDLIKLELEASITQQETAKNQYMQIKESFEKWIKLQEELKILSKKKDMLEQIQKLLKGSAFIEFISEERMRYIAREASETLGELTKFRYSIELDSENGFVIRDNANGGVLRSVASLSGGETFLASLALALALSSQLQLKGQSPLEFFFLDEGFGTLDSTLLDVVIDSLERLGSSTRVIGLISHVPEMKNRITRRLIVEAPDRTGKGSKISIEKA